MPAVQRRRRAVADVTEAYWTTDEVAAHYRISSRTVEDWRHRDVGPRWVRIGRRALYPLSAIREYDAEREAAS